MAKRTSAEYEARRNAIERARLAGAAAITRLQNAEGEEEILRALFDCADELYRNVVMNSTEKRLSRLIDDGQLPVLEAKPRQLGLLTPVSQTEPSVVPRLRQQWLDDTDPTPEWAEDPQVNTRLEEAQLDQDLT